MLRNLRHLAHSSGSSPAIAPELSWPRRPVDDTVRILEECEPGLWKERNSRLCQELKAPRTSLTTVIFVPRMLIFHWDFSENQERPDIHEKFWKVLTNDVDGSFYSNFIMDGVRASPRHVSFSSFKVKNVTPDTITWAQPTVYVEWELQVGHQTVILYDISPDLNVSRISLAHRSNPYAWHCLLGQIVTELYDTSAWQMSDIVRSIERGLEILFNAKELFSIKLRNQFLRERLNNALSLALNLTQMHAKSDSAAMKTIAVLSLIYLPGTFVSGLFGTNFFRYPAENSTEAWWASSKFWLYGAIAGPLTALTLAAWLCVYYYPKLRRWVSSRKTLKEKKRF